MTLNHLFSVGSRRLYRIGFRSISTFEKKDILQFKTYKTLEKYSKYITLNGLTSLFIWGGTIAIGALLFSQGIPRVRTQIHQQLPIFGSSFNTDADPSDTDL